MPEALDVLHERGGATEPDPEFRTELMWRVRTALAAPNVAVQVVEDESDRRPDRADDDYRRRWVLRAAAVVLVFSAIGGLVWLIDNRDDDVDPADVPTTMTVTTEPGVSFSERVFDPLSGRIKASSMGPDGAVWHFMTFQITNAGVRVSGSDESQPAGVEPTEVPPDVLHPTSGPAPAIVDTAYFSGGGNYALTCCTDGHGTLWRNGEEVGPATSMDFDLAANGGFGYIDATTGTVVVGEITLEEPGAIDLAVLSDGLAAALVGGTDPYLVVYNRMDTFENDTPERTEVSLPDSAAGACAIVGLELSVVVFVGQADGDDDACPSGPWQSTSNLVTRWPRRAFRSHCARSTATTRA